MKVNFAGSEIPDFSPIAAGEYHFIVTDGTIKESKDGPSDKNPTGQYVSWELTCQDAPFIERKAWTNTPLGGSGLGFLKGILWATGNIEKSHDGDLDFEIEEVVGGHILAKVTVDKERDSNNVRNIRPYSEVGAAESLLPS